MDRIQFSKVDIGEEEVNAVSEVLRSGWLAAGPKTEQFEKEFAKYVGVKYAIFTNSCTSALKMAYKWAMEERPHEFIVMNYPANTFCATYSAGIEMGITMYPRRKWKFPYQNDYPEHTKVNVHYGSVKDETPCLIEDSAHRIEPNDPLVGKIRCYSFYATKNMTTGSGGMFTTNDRRIYERARLYWKDGLTTSTKDRNNKVCDYEVRTMAGGYDGNDIAAAIGLEQLKKLPTFTKRRNQIVEKYNKAFGQDWGGNHLYPVFVNSEKEVTRLREYLHDKGIMSGYHYPGTGWLGVSLPLYPLLTDKEVDYIIEAVCGWTSSNTTK